MYSRFLLLILLLPGLAFGQLTIEEHLSMENVANPRLSPNGELVAYLYLYKETWDGNRNSVVMITDLETEEGGQVTSGGYDYNLQWSPDGRRVAFLSYRENLLQVYSYDLQTGEMQKVTNADAYISGYAWVSDTEIAYVDDLQRDVALTDWEKTNQGYIVGTEFFQNALWVTNLETNRKTQISSGEHRIIDFSPSPDGNHFAMVTAPNYDDYQKITNSRVEVIDRSGKIIYSHQDAEAYTAVRFAPDGEYIAFSGSTVGYSANDGLFIADWKNGSVKNVTYEFGPTIQSFQWVDDRVAFLTPYEGSTAVYSVNLKGKIDGILDPGRVVYDFSIQNKTIAYTASASLKPNQLFVNSKQLTNINEGVQDKIRTTYDILSHVSGAPEGIVTYPPDYDPDTKYPLMVIPHGGPDAVVLNDFHWEKQWFADNGYIVYHPNFRGSIGYGREHYAGNRGSFGYNDFDDIMTGVNYLINKGSIDTTHMVIGGGSYGGYMAGWAITRTNRFKAAIGLAGMYNLVSMYGQHEFSNRDIALWEYGTRMNDDPEVYRKSSPVFFVDKINTPLLILHGQNDTRSPTLQAFEMYRAMKDANKEVEMIIYYRAGHSITRPAQFKSMLENWLSWANKQKLHGK